MVGIVLAVQLNCSFALITPIDCPTSLDARFASDHPGSHPTFDCVPGWMGEVGDADDAPPGHVWMSFAVLRDGMRTSVGPDVASTNFRPRFLPHVRKASSAKELHRQPSSMMVRREFISTCCELGSYWLLLIKYLTKTKTRPFELEQVTRQVTLNGEVYPSMLVCNDEVYLWS